MNSRDYWLKREEEALKHRITDEKEYQKEIDQIYQNMLDACQKEIESFYAKYASAEGISIAEAKKRVAKHDVKAFERKAAKYVKDKDFSDKANEELRLYNATMKINRLEMLKANIGLETIAGHDELEKFMAGILKGRTEDELKRQAGILGKTVLNNAAKANAIVNGSFKVAKVGDQSTFSDRIWQYQDNMRQDLGKLLQQGLIQGKNPRAITKDLRKYWYGNDPRTGGGAKYCTERLMRTELARVQTEAQKQSFERNGFEHYEFIANIGCCPLCMAKDGKHFEVKKMMPGENAPPMHPNCRCSTAAWEDDEEYEAWLDHLANGGTTEQWNNRIKISSPGSPQSFRRSLKEISEGKAKLDKRRQNILRRVPETGDYYRFERDSISLRDLAYLSAETGKEFALFRSKRHDILIHGRAANCYIAGDLQEEIIDRGYEWIAHSHVDRGILKPSPEDRETLRLLKQKTSTLVGIDGEQIKYSQSEFDD